MTTLWLGVLLFTAAAVRSTWAEPEAPVVWGEARYLGIVDTGGDARTPLLLPMGDTLVFARQPRDTMPPYRLHVDVAVSYDQGLTHSDWQCLDDSSHPSTEISVAGDAGHIHVAALRDGLPNWTRTSHDGGASWEAFRNYQEYLGPVYAQGSMVALLSGGVTPPGWRISLSQDYGQTWPVAHQPIDTARLRLYGMAVTRHHILVAGKRSVAGNRMLVATSSRDGMGWTPFTQVPGDPMTYSLETMTVGGDTSSDAAGILGVWSHGFWDPEQIFLYRTADGGQSWEPPVALSGPCIPPDEMVPFLFCRGNLWGVVWRSGECPDEPPGMYCRLSPNHGRTWYPPQRIDSVNRGWCYTLGQFVGHEVRVYWNPVVDADWTYKDFRTVTGLMTPDTLPPVLNCRLLLPDTLRAGDTLRIEATAVDNEAVFDARFQVGVLDSIQTVTLQPVNDSLYRGEWVVPFNAWFRWRAVAEDRWENTTSSPDTGWHDLYTGPQSPAREGPPALPLTFTVNVFPNPANGWPRLELSPEWFREGPVELTLYNVLGQALWSQRVTQPGEVRGALSRGPAAGTGLYFLRAATPRRQTLAKFLVLK